MKNECKNCIHFEVCAYAHPDLPVCDSFVNKEPRAKRFIILSSEDLDKIRNNQVVTCENCDFSSSEPPYELLIEKGYELTFRPVPMRQNLIQLVSIDPKSNRHIKVMVDVTTSGTLYEDPVFETVHMMIEAMDSYRRSSMNRVVWEGWTVKDFINYIEPAADQIMYGFAMHKPFKTKAEMAKYVTDAQPYYKMPIPEVIEYFANRYGLK